jgi:hypothetical protein
MSPAVPMSGGVGTNGEVVGSLGPWHFLPAAEVEPRDVAVPESETSPFDNGAVEATPIDLLDTLSPREAAVEDDPLPSAAAETGELYSELGHVRLYKWPAYRLVGGRVIEAAGNWAAKREEEPLVKRVGRMAGATAMGSFKWVNLTLGEPLAIWLQAHVQSGGGSHVESLGAFMGASLITELGFSLPYAVRNTLARRKSEAPPETHIEKAERLSDAAVQGFFLGGSWGTEARKLTIGEMPIPIVSYLGYGAILGTVTETNHLAATLVSSPLSYAALALIAGVKTFNDVGGFKGWTEKMAEWAAAETQDSNLVKWLSRKFAKGASDMVEIDERPEQLEKLLPPRTTTFTTMPS